MAFRQVEKITKSKKFPRFSTKVSKDSDWGEYVVDIYVDGVNQGEGPRARVDDKQEALAIAEYNRNFEGGKYAKRAIDRVDQKKDQKSINKKSAETRARNKKMVSDAKAKISKISFKELDRDIEFVETSINRLKKDGKRSAIRTSRIKLKELELTLLKDERSKRLKEIRHDNQLQTGKEAQERYKGITPPWPITQKGLNKSAKPR